MTASDRIRELWPLVVLLRQEGCSWRQVPRQMHMRYGVPLVAHAMYLRIAKGLRD